MKTSWGLKNLPNSISPILQAFYESQLIGRNFWTIKILCDSCMNRNLRVLGRKTVQVANEFISPFTTVSEPSTRMTAWHGCTKHLRSSSCTAEMPTSFLRHNKHNVQSIFWNAFYPTSLILSWTLKSSEDALSKMKCSAFSQWYQILFFVVQCGGCTILGIPSQDWILSKPGFSSTSKSFLKTLKITLEHSIEPWNASLQPRKKKKSHWESHPMKFWLVKNGGFLAVMYISSIKISKILQSTYQTNCCISFCSSKISHK